MTITQKVYTGPSDQNPTVSTISLAPEEGALTPAAMLAAAFHGLVAALGATVALDHHPDAATCTLTITAAGGARAEIGPVAWPKGYARHLGLDTL